MEGSGAQQQAAYRWTWSTRRHPTVRRVDTASVAFMFVRTGAVWPSSTLWSDFWASVVRILIAIAMSATAATTAAEWRVFWRLA